MTTYAKFYEWHRVAPGNNATKDTIIAITPKTLSQFMTAAKVAQG